MVYLGAVAASVEEATLAGGSSVWEKGEKQEMAGAGVSGTVLMVQSGRRRRRSRHDIHPWNTSRTPRSQTPRCERYGIRVSKFMPPRTFPENKSMSSNEDLACRFVCSCFSSTTTLQASDST